MRAYDGPRRPASEVATLRCVDPFVPEEVAGRRIDRRVLGVEAELLPGRHTVVARFSRTHYETKWGSSMKSYQMGAATTATFEARAGHHYTCAAEIDVPAGDWVLRVVEVKELGRATGMVLRERNSMSECFDHVYGTQGYASCPNLDERAGPATVGASNETPTQPLDAPPPPASAFVLPVPGPVPAEPAPDATPPDGLLPEGSPSE
jgi:hypothetical protein